MVMISGGLYATVRYAPHFNKERPYQIVATNRDIQGTYVTEMTYREAADLVRSLSLLLLKEATNA
jgi:hypothetical protein